MNTSPALQTRRVARVVQALSTLEGGGFPVRRPFPIQGFSHFDPFLLIDHLGPGAVAAGRALGAPDHPHRGFETVTYVLGRRERASRLVWQCRMCCARATCSG
jgi:redox-sensitive bicupin YhaK (pirin superfamily)